MRLRSRRAGQSQAGPAPRSTAPMVRELSALLASAGVAPPYVMGGHSLGGLNARLYAIEHPASVAGVVLIESAHEKARARLRELVSDEQ